MQVVATAESLLARVGPIEPAQVTEALALYKALYNQHAQLLAATVVIAGPSLNAVGSPPAYPAAIRTYSWCYDGAGPGGGYWLTNGHPLAKTGATPRASNYVWTADNAGSKPTFWSDRWIQQVVSGVESDAISIREAYKGGPATAYVAGATIAAVKAEGFFTRTINTQFEIVTGYGAQEMTVITNWGVFITTIALPLLNTYQTVLRNLADRLKATFISNVDERKAAWTMLLSCSVEVTEFTLDKLEVLRDPIGSPIYLPPASVSVVRDSMMASVIDSYRAILPSARFDT